MSKISDQVIEQVQQRCEITDIISSYIPLKKAGRNYKALCPFHHEKTPSFVVSPDKQIFHCFGCAAGGDVFAFIMKHERLEFPEAVRFLAERAGVKIEENKSQGSGAPKEKRALFFKLNKLAALYFRANLLKSQTAEPARNYLKQRQITRESIEIFGLGYAGSRWDGLLNFLRSKGVKENLLVRSGLVVKSPQGKIYDRFRERIMFPIFDVQGRILGFGGRILKEEKDPERGTVKPKYINSPESEIYSKSNNLFGLNLSRRDIQDKDLCVVVEGYLDFIMPYQFGIKNLVASLGTAFTASHVRILKRYTKNFVILFDADNAGQEAALRSLDLLIEEGMNVRVAAMESGFDPDTYVRRFGRDKFEQLINRAKSLFDFKLELLCRKYDRRILEQKAFIVTEMLSTIKKLKNAVLRNAHLKKLAEELHVPEEAVREELARAKPRYSGSPGLAERLHDPASGKFVKIAEKMLVSLMLDDGNLLAEARKTLSLDEFTDPVARSIVRVMFEQPSGRVSAAWVLNKIQDQKVSSYMSGLMIDELGIKDRKKTFNDCIKRIKTDNIRTQKKILQEKIKDPSLDDKTLNLLLKKYEELKKEQRAYEKAKKETS